MIIRLKQNSNNQEIEKLENTLKENQFDVFKSYDKEKHIILGAVGPKKAKSKPDYLEYYSNIIEEVIIPKESFLLSSRAFHPLNTVINVKDVQVGGDELIVMAGPCAVESREQVIEAAELVSKCGAKILRGGAFKPRTSPYSFQGLGETGLKYLREAGDKFGLPIITEVLDTKDVQMVAEYADIVQIGARNMQNFRLLSDCGKIDKAVLIKRGLAATFEELLMSAEYVMASGNNKVMLCERGVRTFEPMTRNTLDISAISMLKCITHLPIVADPSHAIGIRNQVIPLARASVAAGSDALLVEVHPQPDKAWVDGAQSLDGEKFKNLMNDIRIIAPAVKKRPPSVVKEDKGIVKEKIFDKVSIIGCGLIGASIALNMKKTNTVNEIVAIDMDEKIEDIKIAGITDNVINHANMKNDIESSDLIIISTPITSILENLEVLSKLNLKKNAIIIDVGSTKTKINNRAKELFNNQNNNIRFYGTHPMTGSEKKGFISANPSLFYDTIWVISEDNNSLIEPKLIKFIESTGAKILVINDHDHDMISSLTSHLPQLIAVELMKNLDEKVNEYPIAKQLAAGGFRDMTRIASSPFEMWKDIYNTNTDFVRKSLEGFIARLNKTLDKLGASDQNDYLQKNFEQSAACRLGIPTLSTGFLKPLSIISVGINDKPGALSLITTALAQAELNIKDLQIVKIREDQDGYLHLAFASKMEAEKAIDILRKVGCETKLIE